MKKLDQLLETITAKQAEIDSHGKLNDQLAKRIQHKFRLDWNYYSNAMEGNSLTKIETKQLMMDNVTIDGKPFKDIAEMRGHDNEVLEIFKIGKGELRISEKRIKQMHAAIIHEEDPEKKAFIGQWKTSDNYLTNYRGEDFYFLPFSEVKDAMHDLLNKTNADIDAALTNKKGAKHPALIAFEFHLRYLEIHPFYDGNGRTGRLLLNLILISFGFPPVILDEQNREKYYRILAEVQGYGLDPKECYAFLAELLVRSQDLVLDAIAGKEIEEDDDVDKEIALLIQSLDEEREVLKRTPSLMNDVYYDSIRPFLNHFLSKVAKFDELFTENNIVVFIEGKGEKIDHLMYLDEVFKYWKQKDIGPHSIFHTKQSTIIDHVQNLNEIRIDRNWKGFKKNGIDVFDIYFDFNLNFQEYHYSVESSNRKETLIKKLYSENINSQEATKLANEMVKRVLEKIKTTIDRQKS